MTAKSTKDTKICITRGDAMPLGLVPADISKAAPAVVSMGAGEVTTSGITDGDIVTVHNTGFESLDGKVFVVSNVDTGADTFELVGSDTTLETATYDNVAGGILRYTSDDLECLCLSEFTLNKTAPGTISVGTFCDPSATLPGNASETTIDFAGYVDITDSAYIELLAAEDDGATRLLRVILPENGYLVGVVTITSIGWDIPLEGGVGYTGTMLLQSAIRHIF